jgi:hypothetical protein
MTSAPRAPSGMPSGTSFSSFNVSFVSAETSGVPDMGFPRSARIVLQHVSMSSLAVPIARLGSVSTDASSRRICSAR